jgi:hypothetical protein
MAPFSSALFAILSFAAAALGQQQMYGQCGGEWLYWYQYYFMVY